MTSNAERELARAIARMQKESRAQARAAQGSRRSVEGSEGPVPYYDEDGVERLQIGAVGEDGEFAIVEVNSSPPPVPTEPDAMSAKGGVVLEWDGTFEEANRPVNLDFVEVHASNVVGFIADDTTQINTIHSPSGGVTWVPLTADQGEWYFKLVSVNNEGLESSPSIEVAASALPIEPDEPTAAPESSPSLTVKGTTNSLVLVAEDVAPSTLITYHITSTPPVDANNEPLPFPVDATTQLNEPTHSTVFVVQQLPDGTPLTADTPYYVRAVASNVVDEAAPGPMSSGALNFDNIEELVLARLVAGFILAGSIQVGQITINPDTGIGVPGSITIPSNGDPVSLTAHAVLESMTVKDNASLSGLTQLFGELRAADGVTDPSAPPQVSHTWPVLQTDLQGEDGEGFAPYYRGLVDDILQPEVRYVSVSSVYGAGLRTINKENGASWPFWDISSWNPTRFAPDGGITSLGGFYWVLGRDLSRDAGWWVYKINPDFVKVGEFYVTAEANFPWRPAIGNDGTNIIIVYTNKDRQVRLRTHSQAGAIVATVDLPKTGAYNFTSCYQGTADWGFEILIVSIKNGPMYSYDPNFGYAETSNFTWGSANGSSIIGMYWNGTRFQSLDEQGRVWKYSKMDVSPTVSAAYSWYDGSDDGTGKHRTAPSPTVFYTWPARSWLVINTGSPPDAGNVDPTKLDKANQVQVHLETPLYAGLYTQETLPEGVTNSTPLDYPTNAMGVPPTTNEFLNAESAPGTIMSTGRATDGEPTWQFSGDGSWRIGTMFGGPDGNAGGVPTGSIVMFGSDTPPVGWLMCDGTALDTAEYPTLFNVIGYSYGGSGAVFYTPNFFTRFPTHAGPGSIGGSDSVTMPDHTHAISAEGGSVFSEFSSGAVNAPNWATFRDHNHGGATGSIPGANPPINTVPKWLGVRFIIKT